MAIVPSDGTLRMVLYLFSLPVSIRKSRTGASRDGLVLSRSLSYSLIASRREKRNRLKPASSTIRVKGADRLREVSGKCQPKPAKTKRLDTILANSKNFMKS
jgi:hypothetical protein